MILFIRIVLIILLLLDLGSILLDVHIRKKHKDVFPIPFSPVNILLFCVMLFVVVLTFYMLSIISTLSL